MQVRVRRLLCMAAAIFVCGCNCGGRTTSANAKISADPLAIDFGNLPVSTQVTRTLTLSNDGTAQLDIDSIHVDGDARGAFAVGSIPRSIAPGGSAFVTVLYLVPSVEGADGASLVIDSDASNAPELRVSLLGRAIGASADGGFDGGPGNDAGNDAGLDAGTDAGFDAGFDAGIDAGFDAGRPDAGPTRGPEAWWKFEETTGTVVIDSTGHGHDGVLEGSGTTRGVAGHSGFAYSFNATDGRVHVPAAASLDFISGATVAAWIDVTNTGVVGQIAARGTGNNDSCAHFETSCGNLQFIWQYIPNTSNATTNCNAFAANTWVHVLAVNDGSTEAIYVNGHLATSSTPALLGPLTSDLYIGRRVQGVFAFSGAIDELKWWTVALTPQEICVEAEKTWTGSACVP